MSKRIVVTGMGAVSPLGCGVEPIWQRLLAGQSGIATLPAELIGDLPISIGGQPRPRPGPAGRLRSRPAAGRQGTTQDGPLHPLRPGRRARGPGAGRLGAAERRGAGAHGDRHRLRVGGFHAIAEAVRTTDGKGPRRLSPFTIPSFSATWRPPMCRSAMASRDRWAPGDRLRGGRASHRRRGADDPRGRGRRGGGGAEATIHR